MHHKACDNPQKLGFVTAKVMYGNNTTSLDLVLQVVTAADLAAADIVLTTYDVLKR